LLLGIGDQGRRPPSDCVNDIRHLLVHDGFRIMLLSFEDWQTRGLMTYFRFGIRDLLWAMAVVGLAVALWRQYSRAEELANNKRYLLEAIDNSGYVAGGNYFGPALERK
jgi:hypothetical protein